MKNVIAYSLWGDGSMYWKGALENIEQAKKYFPNWICRFYIDRDCHQDLINTIKGDNVEVILIDSKDSFHGMFWRFYAACDTDVDIMLSRDCDSRFSDREYYAIQDWLKSDKDFHIMRDHPYHTVPILGGMWGCRNGILRDIDKDIKKWTFFSQKGCDQDFLGQIIYPKIINNAIEHIGFNINFGGNIKPFPTERKNYEYVGDIFDENNIRHPEYWKIIKNI
jgi:hypothetical protein